MKLLSGGRSGSKVPKRKEKLFGGARSSRTSTKAKQWNYLFFTWARQTGAPVDWVRALPVLITGPTYILPKKAPHPNAIRLLIEWLYSSQGMVAFEKITGYGAAAPGSGTHLSKLLEGLPLVYRTEEVLLEADRLRLIDRFPPLLGITPK